MKRKINLVTALFVSLVFSSAHAEEDKKQVASHNLYVSGSLGLSNTNDMNGTDEGGDAIKVTLKNATVFSLALGRNLNDRMRAEIELSYRKADVDKFTTLGVTASLNDSDATSTQFLINGYYDLMAGSAFTPYASLGVGMAHHKMKFEGTSKSDRVFAYQAGIGVRRALSEKTELFGSYRYVSSAEPDFDGLKLKYSANELRFGINYHF